MRRKVIQFAGKTNLISLPISWTRKYNIKKGDELEVKEKGDELFVSSNIEKKTEKITIDISKFSDMSLKYCLSAMHKSGYDEIILLNPSQLQIPLVQEVMNNLLLGFVIIEQTQKKIILKSVSTDIANEFDSTLRRVFLVTLSFADSSLEIVKSKNFFNLKNLMTLDKTNDQLTSFCLRLLNKGVYNDNKTLPFIIIIVWALEKISDEYKYLCNFLYNNNISISDEVINIYSEVNNFFRVYYELFYKFDIIILNEVSDKRFEIIKLIEKTQSNNKIDYQLLAHLKVILNKTVDLSSSLFALKHLNLDEVKDNL